MSKVSVMKVVLIVAVVVSISFAAFLRLANKAKSPDAWVTRTAGRFALEVPASWKSARHTPDNTIVLFSGPTPKKLKMGIICRWSELPAKDIVPSDAKKDGIIRVSGIVATRYTYTDGNLTDCATIVGNNPGADGKRLVILVTSLKPAVMQRVFASLKISPPNKM